MFVDFAALVPLILRGQDLLEVPAWVHEILKFRRAAKSFLFEIKKQNKKQHTCEKFCSEGK